MGITMKLAILLSAVFCCFSSPNEDLEQKWLNFKITFNKSYTSPIEESNRFLIFQEKLKKIEEHNALYQQGLVTFKKGVTQFSDLTDDEFLNLFGSSIVAGEIPTPTDNFTSPAVLPDFVNWVEWGAVTPVKDQGSTCYACSIFTAVGSLEGRFKIKTGFLASFSEQNLVDCDSDHCEPGYLDTALKYMVKYGVTQERNYPYTGTNGTCRPPKNVVRIRNYKEISGEYWLKAAVAQGPVAVAIKPSPLLGEYTTGIYYDQTCDRFNFTHALLAVGYGTENGTDYWLVKNSWGTEWGDHGYMKLARGYNTCGFGTFAAYAIV